MELKEALQTALDFETKGHQIYVEAAEKTKNQLVKKTFSYLAEQEEIHMWEIKGYIEKEHPEIEQKGAKKEELKKIFNTNIEEFKEKAEMSNDDIEAYKTALELEKSSYNYYKEQNEIAEAEEAKTFFKFLMEQESAHYDFIEATYNYLKDPEHFNQHHEGWLFEGG